MAAGRTISASFLTALDRKVIELCGQISNAVCDSLTKAEAKIEFKKEYGKISDTRDGGLGLGGGKLQRDALCTRGRQGKAPFSNRNLRWHPLIAAESSLSFARTVNKIKIAGEDDSQVLIFVVTHPDGTIREYPADRTYEMPGKYVVLPEHWLPHIERLKHWSDTLWTQNSCVIPALESCNWWDSVETYAVLGIAIAVDLYGASFTDLYRKGAGILRDHGIGNGIVLPTSAFPTTQDEIVACPVCKINISKGLEAFRTGRRAAAWQPAWRSSKKEEGDDSSIQLMHVNPLVEQEIRHNAYYVRYGHRWCNVAMTDHSLEETLDFMEYIVKAHNRCKK